MVDVLGRTVVLAVLDGAAVKWWMFWAEQWSSVGCFGWSGCQIVDVLVTLCGL